MANTDEGRFVTDDQVEGWMTTFEHDEVVTCKDIRFKVLEAKGRTLQLQLMGYQDTDVPRNSALSTLLDRMQEPEVAADLVMTKIGEIEAQATREIVEDAGPSLAKLLTRASRAIPADDRTFFKKTRKEGEEEPT